MCHRNQDSDHRAFRGSQRRVCSYRGRGRWITALLARVSLGGTLEENANASEGRQASECPSSASSSRSSTVQLLNVLPNPSHVNVRQHLARSNLKKGMQLMSAETNNLTCGGCWSKSARSHQLR